MKFFKRVLIIFSLLGIIFIAGGIAVSYIFSDEVKQKLVSEINKRLKSEIKVSEIHFSVLRKFPNASLEFRDVLIKSGKDFQKDEFPGHSPDTLLWAERVFLEFGLRSLISKEYVIKRVKIEYGLVNLLIDSAGNENFRFWETKEQTSEVNFKIDLQNVRILSMGLFFFHNQQNIGAQAHVNRAHFNGNFSAYQYKLTGFSDIFVNRLIRDSVNYFQQMPFSTSIELDVSGDLYKMNKGQLRVGEMRFFAEGEFFGGGINRIDLSVVGDNLDLISAKSFLSGDNLAAFMEYNPYGSLDFNARMHGRFSRYERPLIEGKFALEKGGLSKSNSEVNISQLSANGSFTNGKLAGPSSYRLNLESFAGLLGKSSFRGNLKIENLANPFLEGNLLFEGLMEEVTEFYKPAQILKAEGELKAGIKIYGYLENFKNISLENITTVFPEIKIEIASGQLFLQNEKWQFKEINGRMQLTKNLVYDNLSFHHHGNSFLLSGELFTADGNIFRKGQKLQMKGSVHSGFFNMDVFLPDPESRSEDKKILVFPELLLADMQFSCDEFVFRNFKAKNIRGIVTYKPKMFVLNSIQFQSMEGNVIGGGAIIQKMNNDFLFQAQTSFRNVNIKELFFSFNNFSQSFITHSHLKGSLTGDLNFISEWTNDFELITDKIVADSRISISGGELVNFGPLSSLSKFIEVEELKHVRFSNLQNEIFIRNQMVTIPKMDIQSSAFNISISGTHKFDNQFNYRLRILLSDVLFSKARKAKMENEQFAITEEDGLGKTTLPLILAGKPDDYKISYDRRAAAEIIKESFIEEKRNLRKILNEEFGWFAKDSTIKKTDSVQQKVPVYKIEWDEEEKKEVAPVRQPAKKPVEKKPFKIEWEEDEKQDTVKPKKSS